MTKQEFIQEAALRMISAHPDYSTVRIADDAEELAAFLFDEPHPHSDPVRPRPAVSDPDEDHVQTLLDEIATDEQRAKDHFGSKHPGRAYQKRGYAIILRHAFDIAGVRTVGDMLKLGRMGCLRLPKVGGKSIEAIDKALENLYNIKNW